MNVLLLTHEIRITAIAVLIVQNRIEIGRLSFPQLYVLNLLTVASKVCDIAPAVRVLQNSIARGSH